MKETVSESAPRDPNSPSQIICKDVDDMEMENEEKDSSVVPGCQIKNVFSNEGFAEIQKKSQVEDGQQKESLNESSTLKQQDPYECFFDIPESTLRQNQDNTLNDLDGNQSKKKPEETKYDSWMKLKSASEPSKQLSQKEEAETTSSAKSKDIKYKLGDPEDEPDTVLKSPVDSKPLA